MGMIFTDDIAHDTGRFFVRLVPVVFQLPHCKQDASVDRLHPVANFRQRPSDDHTHGIIEIRFFHLALDTDLGQFLRLQHIPLTFCQ